MTSTHGIQAATGELRTVDAARALLRHIVATLAYRAGKALRDSGTTPMPFAEFRLTPTTRTPAQILAHMSDLLDWALWMCKGHDRWRGSDVGTWEAEVERFYNALAALDDCLASDAPLGAPLEAIFQGPLADALTHVGQLTMLRGVAGAPVRPESYDRAEIVAGRVGPDQPPPKREFDGDASAYRPS